MRYPASEKLEIIRIVERSDLPTKVTLDKLGVSRPTFYRWYDLVIQLWMADLSQSRNNQLPVFNHSPPPHLRV